MKKYAVLILALTLSACLTSPYTEDLRLPNPPNDPERHITEAVERFSSAIDRDLPHSVLSRWSIEYIGQGHSATYFPLRVIRIAKENDPELVLKHEIIHALLFEGGAPSGVHHTFMCRHDLCYGSVGCQLTCE